MRMKVSIIFRLSLVLESITNNLLRQNLEVNLGKAKEIMIQLKSRKNYFLDQESMRLIKVLCCLRLILVGPLDPKIVTKWKMLTSLLLIQDNMILILVSSNRDLNLVNLALRQEWHKTRLMDHVLEHTILIIVKF